MGDLWARCGEAAWLGSWQEVYRRPAGATPDVLAELQRISGPTASAVDLLLHVVEGADRARSALAGVYDADTMAALAVLSIGDGAAMSGILIAGQHADASVTVVILLMD